MRAERLTIPLYSLYIGGRWQSSSGGTDIPVATPATGEVIGSLPTASVADVDAAVHSAREAVDGGEWSRLSGAERGRLLWRLADLMDEHRETLAGLETLENGRPFHEPFDVEVPLAAEVFRYYAGWADKLYGSTVAVPDFMGRERLTFTVRRPIGVIAAITPWNAPTMIASWKLAPALAAGNAVVVKPAGEASLSTLRLIDLCDRAGFPPGAVNAVVGSGGVVGEALVRHRDVDKVSFTGSVDVGRHIAAIASGDLKRITLELGGKSPQIIRADADLDLAVAGATTAMFANQGQTCAAGSRVLVHRSILHDVLERLQAAAEGVRVGDPWERSTSMGSLINEAALIRVGRVVDAAVDGGAQVIAGGRRLDRPGFYFEPTVVLGTNEMPIAREEIFGPVGVVIPFDTDEEAIRMANDSAYGLTAVVWTRDIGVVGRFVNGITSGSVWINAWGPPHPSVPWSGLKASGVGEELGIAGIHADTVERTVSIVGSVGSEIVGGLGLRGG